MPDGDEPKPLVVAAPTDGGQAPSARQIELSYGDTRRAGLYEMTWRDSVTGAMSQQFAVNPDRRESNLERINAEDFRRLWGALEPEVISINSGGDTSLAVRGREIWRTLATCMLGLLVVEACFARWTGRQR